MLQVSLLGVRGWLPSPPTLLSVYLDPTSFILETQVHFHVYYQGHHPLPLGYGRYFYC